MHHYQPATLPFHPLPCLSYHPGTATQDSPSLGQTLKHSLILPYTNATALKRANWQQGRWQRAKLRAVVAVAVVMGVDAGAAVMGTDDDAVAAVVEMGVEVDVGVGCTAPGWTAAHNGQNQTH